MLGGMLAEMVRSRWRSRGKDLDAVLGEAQAAMRVIEPDLRMAMLHRVLAQVRYLKHAEPERSPKVEAALLDLILESLDASARREPQFAAALGSVRASVEEWRAKLGAGDDFEDEVESIRMSLYP